MFQQLHREEEVENGSIDYIIKTAPIALDVDSESVNKVSNYYLPYSTGFEIECNQKDSFNTEDFLSIPYIMDVQIDGFEQRFRIPSGIKGLQCLYNISLMLKKNSLLNKGSGIHYHVDFTDTYDKLNKHNVELNEEWMLEELDSWNYKGSYNSRAIKFTTSHNWARFQEGFKTMEFRIGEMTFEYDILFKRITHANQIVRRLKNQIKGSLLVAYDDDIESVINNRIKRI